MLFVLLGSCWVLSVLLGSCWMCCLPLDGYATGLFVGCCWRFWVLFASLFSSALEELAIGIA